MIASKSKTGLAKPTIDLSSNGSQKSLKNENPVRWYYYHIRKEQYNSNADCFLNLSKVLYDREIACLGSSKIVNKINWESIFEIVQYKHKRETQMNAKLAGQSQLWNSFFEWMKLFQQPKDAQPADSERDIKIRVERLYLTILNAPEESQIKLLRIIAKSSQDCRDGALAGLEKAELIAQIVTLGEDRLINILVLAFKRRLIGAMLVPADSKESVETYLYYSILLNDAFMLKTQTLSMLHTLIAVKCSVDEAVKRIFGKLTLEDAVCFISNNKYFRKAVLNGAYPNKVGYLRKCEALKLEIAMILDPNDPQLESLNDEYAKISDDFYKPIAQELLMQKGFITKNVHYPDPVSFPTINLRVSSEEPNGIAAFEVEDLRKWTLFRDAIFICLVVCMNLFVYGMNALLLGRASITH